MPPSANDIFQQAFAAFRSGRAADAERLFKALLDIEPKHVGGLNLLGALLVQLKRYQEAEPYLQRALKENASSDSTFYNYGLLLKALDRPAEALQRFSEAIAINPGIAESWNNRGATLNDLFRHQEAIADFDKAIAIKPDYAEALFNKGNALRALDRYREAFLAYDRAFALNPALPVEGSRLMTKLQVNDWSDLRYETDRLMAGLRNETAAALPFDVLTLPTTAADQLRCARRYVATQPAVPPLWHGEAYAHDRIRVAYLSADFHDHATAYLMAGLFDAHDRSRFEVAALSFGPDDGSEMRRRITASFERFVDVRAHSNGQIAGLVRDLEIDIAVDLKGYTKNCRAGILARRPAPIQVNYLGYPGTMGADHIDYILADSTVIPEDQLAFYSESVVRLPGSYQVNDRHRRIGDRVPTRGECGLPEAGFVFCCFNNTYKITPDFFDIWMRLLMAVEGSVLWLFDSHPAAADSLRREGAQRGVAPERLVFAPKLPLAEHLARHRHADLFLDTLPYNAHTTASDALWAGLPVLTCLGETFAGRVAASLLRAVGLAELVALSPQDYECLALELARDPVRLMSLKTKLATNRDSHPLFDTDRTTRHIEEAYVTMWKRYRTGQPPGAFDISGRACAQ